MSPPGTVSTQSPSQASPTFEKASIGRQPIFNARAEVVGYELLYRSSNENAAAFTDGDQATSDVLVNAFINVGLEELVGKHPAFVNLTRDFLMSEALLPDAPGKIVLEVLEDIVPDDALIDRLTALSQRGFTIALDDFVRHSNLTPLLTLADIVKVDLPGIAADQLADQVEELKCFPLRLLAEKVETHAQYDLCKELGFELFQGCFLARPEIVQGRKIGDNRLVAIRVLAKLSDPQVDLGELESIIAADAAMAYKFLRFVNSAHFGLARKVSSIKHALALLGLSGVRNVVALLTLAGMAQTKPLELLRMAFIRAQMAVELAQSAKHENPSAYFMAGLFSLLDAILDQPLDEILRHLPLEDWVLRGIEQRTGSIGDVLNCVEAYEQGDFDRARLESIGVDAVGTAYWAAVKTAAALDEAT